MGNKNENVGLTFVVKGIMDLQKSAVELERLAQAQMKVATVSEKTSRSMYLSWKSIGRLFMGQLITRSLHALIGAMRQSMDEAAKFSIRIGEIRTISRNAALDTQTWTRAVIDLSDAFDRTAFDTAEGVYQMLSNQIAEGAESLLATEQAMKLATATVSTTEDAVQALTGSLNAYGAGVQEAGRYSDIFGKTVELGRVRLSELANTMGRVNMPAAQLGMNFEETASSIVVLTRQGIRSNEAMTGLRNVMLKLLKPSKAMEGLFKKWGVDSGEAAVRTYTFAGVLGMLEEEVSKNSDAFAELAKYFSRIRAIVGAGGLVSNFKLLKDTLAEIRESVGWTQESFEEISQTAGYKWTREWQEVKNYFMNDFGLSIIETTVSVTEKIGGLSESIEFLTNSLIEVVKISTAVGAGFVMWKLASITTGIVVLTAEVGFAKAAVAGLTKNFIMMRLAALGPVGLIVAGLGAITYASYKLYESLADGTDILQDLAKAEVAEIQKAEAEKMMAYKKTRAKKQELDERMLTDSNRIVDQMVAKHKAALNKLTEEYNRQKALADLIRDYRFGQATTSQAKFNILDAGLKELSKDLRAAIATGTAEGVDEAEKILKEMLSQAGKADSKMYITPPDRDRGQGYWESAERILSRRHIGPVIKLMQQQLALRKEETVVDRVQLAAAESKLEAIKETSKAYSDRLTLLKESASAEQKALSNLGADVGNAKGALLQMSQAFDQNFSDSERLWESLKVKAGSDSAERMAKDWTSVAVAIGKMQAELVKDPDKQSAGTLEYNYEIIKKLGPALAKYHGLNMDSFSKQLKYLTDQMSGVVESQDILKRAVKVQLDVAKEAKVIANQLVDLETSITSITNSEIKSSSALLANLDKVTAALAAIDLKIKALQTQAGTLSSTLGSKAYGGLILPRFASGGMASDTINAMLRPGEMVMNPKTTSEFYPQLVAMNSRAARFGDGGNVTNTSIGDINVTVQGGETSDITARRIGEQLRRDVRRGLTRLN